MSLMYHVASLLEEYGPQTVAELLRRSPGVTRRQVQSACWNLAHRGRVHIAGREGRAGIYSLGPAPIRPRETARRPVNSVWELARRES